MLGVYLFMDDNVFCGGSLYVIYITVGNEISNPGSNSGVTHWPSTEPSIKRCACVTAKQVHPVEDIEISPWPVDVVEFGANAYAHRKQVDVKQLYNQVTRTAWVSSSQLQFEFEFRLQSVKLQSQLETVENKMPNSEPAADRVLGPSVTHGWAAQPRSERNAAMVRGTWVNMWQSVPVSNSPLTHNQHQPFRNPFQNKVWEVYFFYKEVCPFVHWSSSLLLTMFPLIYVFVYSCVMDIQHWAKLIFIHAFHQAGFDARSFFIVGI